MYEWEAEITKENQTKNTELEIFRLKENIRQMQKTMQIGRFTDKETENNFHERLRAKNLKLSALEQSILPNKKRG